MVVSVMAYFFQIIVFAADTEAFLRIGATFACGGTVAQDDVFELVHARIGKHQRRVVFDDHRRRRDNKMPLRLEELDERVADFVCSHLIFILCVTIFQKVLQR